MSRFPERDLNIRKFESRILMQINESWLAIFCRIFRRNLYTINQLVNLNRQRLKLKIRRQVSNVDNYSQIISSYAKSPLFVKYGLYIKGSPLLKESL